MIPPRATRIQQRPTDWQLYQQRHQIEILFGFMKHYRRVFARFEKLARRYLAFVHLVAACILLRSKSIEPSSVHGLPLSWCRSVDQAARLMALPSWK